MEMTDALVETAAIREILMKKDLDLKKMRELTKALLGAYVETLKHGGAVLAANRYTNPLVAEAEDQLGLLK